MINCSLSGGTRGTDPSVRNLPPRATMGPHSSYSASTMQSPPPRSASHEERQSLLPVLHSDASVAPFETSKQTPQAARKAPPHELLGLSLVAVSALCFSIVTTLVKYETMQGMTSMEAIFWRSSVAFVLNRLAMLVKGVDTHVPREDRSSMMIQCLFGFACIAFGFYAISRMMLADASVLIFLSPVLTLFLGSFLLQEPLDPVCLACALFSGVGVICVLRPSILFDVSGEDPDTRAPTVAVISALLAALTQALLYVSVRKLQTIHSLVVAHYYALFSSTAALSFILIFQSHVMWPTTTGLQLSVVGTGVFAFVGQATLTKGFQLEHAGIAAVMRYLDVVCVFIWDSTWLHEPVNPWSVTGAAIVCACALMCALRKARIL